MRIAPRLQCTRPQLQSDSGRFATLARIVSEWMVVRLLSRLCSLLFSNVSTAVYTWALVCDEHFCNKRTKGKKCWLFLRAPHTEWLKCSESLPFLLSCHYGFNATTLGVGFATIGFFDKYTALFTDFNVTRTCTVVASWVLFSIFCLFPVRCYRI